METLNHIPFNLDPQMLIQHVHIHPDSDDALEFEKLIHLARQEGKPKALFNEVYVEHLKKNCVSLNGVTFASALLRENLTNIDRVFPFVVTCGHEMDQVIKFDGDILKQFWWDVIKESLLLAASQHLLGILQYKYQLKKIASMSPGSGDVAIWPIEQQRELFTLLGDVQGQIGVELTDTFLMVPNKTVSGIHFPTERDFRTCQVCHRQKCPNRSAPFDHALWESINLKEENPTYDSE